MRSVLDFGLHPVPKVRTENCPVHGSFDSKCFIGSIWSKCPVCNSESIAKDKVEQDEKDRLVALQAWQRKIGDAGIPERFRDRRLQTYRATIEPQQRALAFASEYAKNFQEVRQVGRCALFIGRPGTGKTHLAVGIGLQVMEANKASVLFTTVMRAVRRVKDTWGKGSGETESGAISALVFPDLLILDEVGVQFGSDTEKLILFDVLNERYEKRKPTLLLSNLALDEVKAYLGERIFDRLREDGGAFVSFDWDSHRKAINA